MTPRESVSPKERGEGVAGRKPTGSLRRAGQLIVSTLALFGLVVLVLGFSPLAQWMVAQWQVEPELRPAEAIVVLGGGASAEGLHLHSSARMFHAMRLYHRDLAPIVAFTGGSQRPAPGSHTEGAAFLEAWKEFGMPATAAVVDPTALNTYENALRMREHLGDRERILLVTSSAHMRRARDTFVAQGFTVLPAPLPPQSPQFLHPASRWSASVGLLYEGTAWLSYRVRGRL